MNTKHLMLFALAVSAVSLSSCKEEPFRITAEEEYTRNFIKNFGLIDPKQDWNFAQASEVNINVGKHADVVKVYCKVDGKYYIVADLNDVEGELRIPIDVPKGSEDLYVKVDGKGYHTKVGGRLNLTDAKSRNIASGAGGTYGGYTITVTDAGYTVFNGQQIMPITSEEVWESYYSINLDAMQANPGVNGGKGLIPEIGSSSQNGNRNNSGIIQNFTINAGTNHKFTFYPMYWQTSQTNTMGIYLLDSNGEPIRYAEGEAKAGEIVRFPIMTIKGAGDIQHWVKKEGNTLTCYLKKLPEALSSYVADNGAPTFLGDDTARDAFFSALKTYWEDGGELNFLNASDSPVSVSPDSFDMVSVDDHYSEAWGRFHISVEFKLIPEDVPEGKPQELVKGIGEWQDCSTWENQIYDPTVVQLIRARGYTVDLGDYEGEIGMYLQTSNDNNIFYSQSTLNTKYFADGDSYACTYKHPVSGRTFFSFEDWANQPYSYGDNDMNDLVFLLTDFTAVGNGEDQIKEEPGEGDEGDEEIIISENPISWIVAAEDLGATDDFDFNDVVFKLSSVTVGVKGIPTKKVRVKALAAGGTLPVYLHYVDNNGDDFVVGPDFIKKADLKTADDEWHKWFGTRYPTTTMINTGIGETATTTAEVTFSADFDVETYSVKSPTDGKIKGFYLEVNGYNSLGSIGGEVTNSDTDSNTTTISSGGIGQAPQMFLIRDNGWRWPKERERIFKAYPSFNDWVKSAENTEWTLGANENFTCRPVN